MKKSKRQAAAPVAPAAPAPDWRDAVAALWAAGVLVVFVRQLLEAVGGK